MRTRLQLLALRAYRRLPWRAKRFLVRRMAPSFTVGVASVVRDDDGRVLMVRHSYRRGWGFPGGLLGRNESPAAAARREACEEVGLDVELEETDPFVVIDHQDRRVDVVFQGRVAPSPGTVSAQLPEIVEVRWFSVDELPLLQKEAVSTVAEMRRRGYFAGSDGAAAGP